MKIPKTQDTFTVMQVCY